MKFESRDFKNKSVFCSSLLSLLFSSFQLTMFLVFIKSNDASEYSCIGFDNFFCFFFFRKK